MKNIGCFEIGPDANNPAPDGRSLPRVIPGRVDVQVGERPNDHRPSYCATGICRLRPKPYLVHWICFRRSGGDRAATGYTYVRRIRGVVAMPADSPSMTALMVVELRNTSYADGPAPVVASSRLPNTAVAPGQQCPFEFSAPDMPPSSALSIRCHVDISGNGAVTRGDLLSTESIPVPPIGDVDGLTVMVSVI